MIRTKTIRRASLCVALSLCLASTANAQSNASGSIYGAGGEPGSTVTIRNTDTGLTREIRVDANGRYNASALPVGKYQVELKRDGQVLASKPEVLVQLGAGSEVSFGTVSSGSGATELDRIEVRGSAMSPIDVSSTDTRSVFTAEQIAKMPIGRNINALALLTPGVVAADSRYGNVASFGGSAASENAFYINGYAVTNPLTNLGSTSLPFDGISQYQAITGGYGAEFGRATGGVVNIITKSGTNEFKAGAQVLWTPESLRSTPRNIYYPKNGLSTDGLLYQNLSVQETDSLTYGAYVSGPIINDRLFFYASGEFQDQDRITVGTHRPTPNGYSKRNYEVPRWLAKLDWYITDNHLLEFTGIGDTTKQNLSQYAYAYTGDNAFKPGNTKNAGYYFEDGGELYIGKYTGYLTD